MLQLSPHWSLRKAGSGAAQKKLKVRLALAALSAGIIYISIGLEIYHEGFTGLSSRYKWEYTFSYLVLHSLQPSASHQPGMPWSFQICSVCVQDSSGAASSVCIHTAPLGL